jgi:hypothetical protein
MFKDANEFSLHIEKLKEEKGFDSYTDTITDFYSESDHEIEDIVKMLNKKIIDAIQREAEERGLMKNSNVVRLM